MNPHSPALPFILAAAEQLALHRGPDGDPDEPRLLIESLLDGARSDTGRAAVAARLAGDPPLLAIFFQNVDLLYEHGDPDADAVSLAVMEALGALEP